MQHVIKFGKRKVPSGGQAILPCHGQHKDNHERGATVEEERKVLENVGRNPKAKVVEDLICYELNEQSLNRYFLIGSNVKK